MIPAIAVDDVAVRYGDVVATAKRDLKPGELLDGEGGYTVWGKLVPAERSLAEGALPIGLAHKVKLLKDVPAGRIVTWADISIPDTEAVRVRRDMERRFAVKETSAAAEWPCRPCATGSGPSATPSSTCRRD